MTTADYIAFTTVLVLVIIIIGIIRWLLIFHVNDDTTYPHFYEVLKASNEKLYQWICNLKTPENDYEIEIFNLIITRYNKLKNL